MKTKTIVAIAAVLVVLGAGYALAGPANGGFWNGMMGYGNGYGYGNGMMNGNGGMMGYSGGMMGGYSANGGSGHCGAGYDTGYGANTSPISVEKAKEAAGQYLISTGNSDLALTEVIEFDNHFYASVKEKSTGIHAFEVLVNKYTGAITPEMGPNMMWNTKYGHMGIGATQATVTEKQAIENAQKFLDSSLPGTRTADVDAFYGYYTIEVTKDGKVYGMLSVNSNTGAVWYHNWHGAFVKILEVQ